MRLTAKERIFLHLLDYVKFQEALEVPPAMTQEGLASAGWVELRHLSQYLRPLLRDELVRERTCHVQGVRQRRKVYGLSEAGQHAAFRLRDRVRAETVTVRDGEGTREEPLAKVLESAGGAVSLLELVHRASAGGPIDLAALREVPSPAFVERLSEAPRLDRFVGRKAELDSLVSEEGPARIIVVRGVAGIGKSSVAAKACELLRGRRNLFWHTLRPWDSRVSVLTALGDFLSSLGKPGLRAVVARGEASQAAEVLREDLPGTRSFLVFDDAHEAPEEILPLFRLLKDAIAGASDVRAVLLTRLALHFYDRRDVALHGLVREIDLSGLASEDIAAFLSPDLDATTGNLGLELGGHPLFLQLVRSSPHAGVPQRALHDLRRFLEEEVYMGLPDPERQMLNLASLYRVPVPEDALFADPSGSHGAVLSLVNHSLLRPVGDERFEVHDSIRTIFAGLLSPVERERLGAFASIQLHSLADRARERGDAVSRIGYLSNALLLASRPDTRADLNEALGDAEEGIGDLPAALTAYKEAMKGQRELEPKARLHRKSAGALRVRGEVDAAKVEVDKGLALLGGMVSVERGWLDLALCTIAAWQEHWDAAYAKGNEALHTFAAFDDPTGRAWAVYQLGFLDIEAPQGDSTRGERLLGEALGLASTLHDAELIARAHTGLAYLFAYRLGRVDEALEHLKAVEALPATLQDPHARRSLLMLKGWIHLELLGDCTAAEGYFQEVTVLGRKIHDSTAIISAHTGLARCTYCRGLVEEARRKFEAAVAELLPTTLSVTALEETWLAAECSLRLGDVAAFARMVSLLDDPRMADAIRSRPLHAGLLRGVDRLLRGDQDGCREAFRDIFEAAHRGLAAADPAHLALVHFVCGITLRVVGEENEAQEHLRQAYAILERYHLRGRQAIAPVAERELVDVLSRARTPRAD